MEKQLSIGSRFGRAAMGTMGLWALVFIILPTEQVWQSWPDGAVSLLTIVSAPAVYVLFFLASAHASPRTPGEQRRAAIYGAAVGVILATFGQYFS